MWWFQFIKLCKRQKYIFTENNLYEYDFIVKFFIDMIFYSYHFCSSNILNVYKSYMNMYILIFMTLYIIFVILFKEYTLFNILIFLLHWNFNSLNIKGNEIQKKSKITRY